LESVEEHLEEGQTNHLQGDGELTLSKAHTSAPPAIRILSILACSYSLILLNGGGPKSQTHFLSQIS
jgi:hypothetical protein